MTEPKIWHADDKVTEEDPYIIRHVHRLLGRKIVAAFISDDEEWGGRNDIAVALILDDDTIVAPWMDPEGNGPGFLDIWKDGEEQTT